jgi:hypothetical protein
MSDTPRMDSAFKQLTSTTPRMNWQLDQCYREGCKLERDLTAVTEQRDRLAEALWSMLNQDDMSAIRAGILLRSLGLQSLTTNEL